MANPTRQKKQERVDTRSVCVHDAILQTWMEIWMRHAVPVKERGPKIKPNAPRRRSAFLNFLLACSKFMRLLVSTSSLLGEGSPFFPPLFVGNPCSSSLESPFYLMIDQLVLARQMRRGDIRLFAKTGRYLLFRRHLVPYPKKSFELVQYRITKGVV
jgi:hypothetical protein